MIRVVKGRLAECAEDGVVRAVRSDLAPITEAGRDLAAAAGPEVQERLEQSGAIPIGGAVLTSGGRLPAAFVIHVATASPEEPQTALTVQRGLRNALRRAVDWGLSSLALPPLGIGVGTLVAEDGARALVEILSNHLDEGAQPLELTIVVDSDYEEDIFRRMVREVRGEEEAGGNPAEGLHVP